jgi:ribosomal protein L44E
MSSVICLDDSSSSSEDDIPNSSGLKIAVRNTDRRVSSTATVSAGSCRTANQASSNTKSIVSPNPVTKLSNRGVSRSATATTASNSQPPKKKAKPTKVYTLIWVCIHGRGKRQSWRKKDLKIEGIYADKNAAEEAKENIMSQHECCGYGDILVGGCWDDEIDLVIRESPLHL